MNKKILNLFAICIVVLTIAFVYKKKNTPPIEKTFTNNIEVDATSSDGNFTNPDTYQDDLLKTIAEQNVEAFEKVSASFKKSSTDTLSDTIAKDIFGEYLKFNTSGDLDPATLQQAVIDTIKNKTPETKLSTSAALTITPSSINNLTTYTREISVTQYAVAKKVASVSKYENKSLYIKNLYITASKLFLKIPVPKDLATYHLELINGYENYVEGFRLMELQATDPAKALLGVQSAQKGNQQVLDAVANLRRIINLNQIVYNKNDLTYAWLSDVPTEEKIKTE